MATAAPTKSPAAVPGSIEPQTLYTLDEASRRAGLGTWALRMARRKGLTVRYKHGRAFILGADLIGYLVADTDTP